MSDLVFPTVPTAPIGSGADYRKYTNAFPDPFFDYASTQMPRSLYDVLRWCFVPGTPVQMADGTLRSIEEIQTGDQVINRLGKSARVVNTSSRPWDDMLVSIATVDGGAVPIESIPEHEHFVVRAPRLKPSCCLYALKPENVEKVKASDVRVGDYLVSPQAQIGVGDKPAVDPYVAGVYLGDGWVMQRYASKGPRSAPVWSNTGRHYAVRFIFAPDGQASLDRVIAALPTLVPVDNYNTSAANVYACHDQQLTDELKRVCSHGAHEKRLTEAVYGWDRDELLDFLGGYIDSDGCVLTINGSARGVIITSCNRSLLLQVRRLCNALGMTPTLSGGEHDGGGGCVPHGRYERYQLFFDWYNMQALVTHSEKLKQANVAECRKGETHSVVISDGTIYRRVRSIVERQYSGSVHNLEVEGEHSYVVSDCATSNCEYAWLTNGTYRTACQRIVRYFLTKVELSDVDGEEKEKYEGFLDKQMKIIDVLATLGDDFMAYGNSISSVWVPFRRYLRCPNAKCSHERSIEHIDYKFEDWEFRATCPVCGTTGKFARVDRRSVEQDKIKIVRWSPHEIRLLYHPISHEVIYYWVPPPDFKREIRRGNKFYVASTPWEIIEAIKDDAMFKFNPGVIYHMKEDAVAGLRNAGWGIPRILANFKQMWYVQVLKRYNEAIGLDYIIPFRVITPGKNSGSVDADPLYHMNIGSFLGKVMGMIRRQRRDPASWNALPFPIEYSALGGEGQSLAPTELLAAGTDELLNAMGFPAELFKATLEVQAAPMALRLFERAWTSFTSALNGWLNWFFDQISDVLNWEKIGGRLQPTTLAEDIEKKQVQLQLAAAQQVSKQTAYSPFGIDYRQEIRRMFEEEKFFADESTRFQKEQGKAQEMEQTFASAQQAANAPPGMMPPQGAPPAGGMGGGMPASPMGGAGGGGMTPNDMMMQAEQLAIKLLGMPYETRKSELLQMKKADETLHALVIQKMETVRRQAQQQGGMQMMQQMAGGQAG